MTPRFCRTALVGVGNVLNDQGNQHNLLTREDLISMSGNEDAVSSAGLGRWLGRRFKGLEVWLRETGNAWFGNAGLRRTKLAKKWFAEVETGDLVHSMSFQKRLADTGGDSTNKARYERFAVAVPCEGWDPQRMFDLTYQWSEAAIQILSNIPAQMFDQNTISMELRHTGHMRLWESEVCTTDEDTGVTTCTTYANQDFVHHAWMYTSNGAERTNNAMLGAIIGLYDHVNHQAMTVGDFKGFASYFACGPRREVHNLPTILPGQPLNGVTLKQCVIDGAETNKRLRSESPGEPFYPDEVVVRLTFGSLTCGGWFMGGGFPYFHLDVWRHTYAVWQNFKNQANYCSGSVPSRHDGWTVGTIHGAGMPELLEMVILDPEDLVEGVGSLR